MTIQDFISNNLHSDTLFQGTYGIEIEAESLQPHNDARFTFWHIKEDGSLRNYGIEYVLKAPVNYAEVYEALEEFNIKMKKTKFIEDSISTSIHVHVNMLPETWKTMANFLTIYTLVENLLIEYSGEFRRSNLFCLPIKSVPYINKLCVDVFKNVHKGNFDFRKMLNIGQIKYAALNLGCLYQFGSVELRSHRGVTDIDLIFQWVTIINDILEFARTDYTPAQILDAYKLRGNILLREIFGNEFRLIKYENMAQLLKDNLWYASNIGYYLDDDQWKKIDEKTKEKEIQYSFQRLNAWSYKLFSKKWNELSPLHQSNVIRRIKQEDSKKGSQLIPIIGLETPQPSYIPWSTAPQPTDWLETSEEVNSEEPE